MTELIPIFDTLRDLGLCRSQAEFSRLWLGRSDHYMAQIGGDPRKASLTSLQLLVCRLNLAALKSKGGPSRRELRSAFVEARTILLGVFEVRFMRPCDRITALDLN